MGLLHNSTILFFGAACLFGCSGADQTRGVDTEMVNIPSSLEDPEAKSDAILTFDEKEVFTGKISQGEVFEHSFKFENTGSGPLVISSVFGSCGCTVVKNYPRGKIWPGEGGSIDVTFDSDNKWGELTVSITAMANTTPAGHQLIIRTDIIVPDNMKIK